MPAMPKPPLGKTVPVEQLAYAIREVESGGVKGDRYKVINSIGATGAYQVMKQYVGPWTKEAFGKAMPLDKWLGNKEAQDKLAIFRLGRSQKKYKSWESAAAVWFSGQPNPDSKASDGSNTVRQYVDKVGSVLRTGHTIKDPGGTTTTDTGWTDDIGGVLGKIAQPFQDIGTAMLSVGTFAEFLLKLALPSTWVRIVCGILGVALLMTGLTVLGLEAKGS